MQKKIIALAIASAMTVPAMAFAAESTLTGQVNMSYDYYKDGLATEAATNRLNSNNTRLIWKGAEDLGNGMSTIWQLDARLQADTGVTTSGSVPPSTSVTANQLFSGNNYLGLKSDSMGALMAGRMDAPYKVSTRNLDVFFDTAGDNRTGNGAGIAGLLSHDARLNNALAYMSPDMGGFSVALATVFGAEAAVANQTKGSAYSLAGMYNAGPIYAALAYQTIKNGSAGTGDLAGTVDNEANALKLGGGFKTDVFTVNALIERPTNKVAATGVSTSGTNFYIGGRFNFTPNDGIRAAFTKRGTFGTTGDAKQYAIGVDHSMSKTTSAYVTYVKTTDDATGAADPSALSFGMKHSF